ncbi:hypothetical protein NOX75_17540, partial [Pseudomonas aeruginosa]|uniref:hypothetical protein n=1 Tax=Pseudomonas aeruginosa TaxID=287 RepID=UPI00210B1918
AYQVLPFTPTAGPDRREAMGDIAAGHATFLHIAPESIRVLILTMPTYTGLTSLVIKPGQSQQK